MRQCKTCGVYVNLRYWPDMQDECNSCEMQRVIAGYNPRSTYNGTGPNRPQA